MRVSELRKKASAKNVILNIKFDRRTNRKRLLISAIAIIAILLTLLLEDFIPEILLTIVPVIGASYILITLSIVLVLNEKHVIRNNIILISLAVLSVLFKGMHWPGSSFLLVCSVLAIAIGYFFYSFKIYYSVQNNKYLRIVGVIASIVITVTSIGTVFKFMHWPGAGIAIYIGLPVFMIVTFIVLITLPNSGYIKWEPEHRRIFTHRLIIIWIFLLSFAVFKILLSEEAQRSLFENESSRSFPYNMENYTIPDAEGLETDQ